MRSEAYKLTGFTAVISALGFLLRWLQNMRIIDLETGLAMRGTGISGLVTALIIIVFAALGFVAFYAMRTGVEPQTAVRSLTGKTIVHTIVSLVPAGLLAISGIVQFFQADEFIWTKSELGIRRVLAVATIVAAYALVLVVRGAKKPEKKQSGRVGAALLLLFGAVWLIAVYKSAASDPVIWRFAVEVLGICTALMAFFYVSGYFFDVPNARVSVFFCETGAFLCVMSCIDEHTFGEALCLGSVALLLLIWGFTITNNLYREPEPPEPEPVGAHLEPEGITFDDFTLGAETTAPAEPVVTAETAEAESAEAAAPQSEQTEEEIFVWDDPEPEDEPEEAPEPLSLIELELGEPEKIVRDIFRDYLE